MDERRRDTGLPASNSNTPLTRPTTQGTIKACQPPIPNVHTHTPKTVTYHEPTLSCTYGRARKCNWTRADASMPYFYYYVVDLGCVRNETHQGPHILGDAQVPCCAYPVACTQMWPYAKLGIEKLILYYLEPLLVSTRPPFLDALRLRKFDLGQHAPKITGMRTVTTKEGVSVDLSLNIGSRSIIILDAEKKPLNVSVQLKEFRLDGVLRVTFAALDGNIVPGFKAIAIRCVTWIAAHWPQPLALLCVCMCVCVCVPLSCVCMCIYRTPDPRWIHDRGTLHATHSERGGTCAHA